MQVLINSGHNIEVHEGLKDHIRGLVESTLSQMSNHITRVEVHLSDENGPKVSSNDKRCMMEARLERRPPIAVTHHADTLDQAISGAVEKLARLIEHTQARRRSIKEHQNDPLPSETQSSLPKNSTP